MVSENWDKLVFEDKILNMDIPINHSIEYIYIQVGQYDRFAIFRFFPGTDAFNLYGGMVYGLLIYTPQDRLNLELAIQSENIGSSDGLILLDGALRDKNINYTLKTTGFWARDVMRLSTMDHEPIKKVYKRGGIKQIPNSIVVPLENRRFDHERMALWIYEQRLDSGTPLIPYEYQKYISLKYVLQPTTISKEEVIKYLIDPSTEDFYNDAAITIHGYHNRKYSSILLIKKLFIRALGNRKTSRTKFILNHLGISNRHLQNFKSNDPAAYNQLMEVVMDFEPETIPIWGWKHSVYWDFERFIHIYLRHYKNFFINGSSKGQGTNFQYEYRDIRSLIDIVISANKQVIESNLKDGKAFNMYGNQGYYYNGNYYTFQIDNDGRLMQFHPQE